MKVPQPHRLSTFWGFKIAIRNFFGSLPYGAPLLGCVSYNFREILSLVNLQFNDEA